MTGELTAEEILRGVIGGFLSAAAATVAVFSFVVRKMKKVDEHDERLTKLESTMCGQLDGLHREVAGARSDVADHITREDEAFRDLRLQVASVSADVAYLRGLADGEQKVAKRRMST